MKLQRVIAVLACFALPLLSATTSSARRDPLDGALFSHLIVIVRQQSPGILEVEEVFAGTVKKGQLLDVPGFELRLEDETQPRGVARTEPITANTRILVFLTKRDRDHERWQVAGSRNCYFWSHDPARLDDLRAKAKSAVDLRKAWWEANHLDDLKASVEALWPFLWHPNETVAQATRMAIWGIRDYGPGDDPVGVGSNTVGDYVAEQLPKLTPERFRSIIPEVASWQTGNLQRDLIANMRIQQRRWEALVARYGADAVIQQSDLFDPDQPPSGGPSNDLRNQVHVICDWLDAGVMGLISFPDRTNTGFIHELALWGARNRVKPLERAALRAFREQPLGADLPAIQAIWASYLARPIQPDSPEALDVVVTLQRHRFPEAIPLMAQFATEAYPASLVHEFLTKITGVDLGNDPKAWLVWYESHKKQLGVED
jgi:hypothetical protein